MPRFQLFDLDDDDDDSSESEVQHPHKAYTETELQNHDFTSSRDQEDSDNDSEAENEPPHPLGFDKIFSPVMTFAPRSRYNLNFDDDDEDWLEQKVSEPARNYPPISSYLKTGEHSTPMKVLLRDAYLDRASAQQGYDEDDEEDDDGLGGLLDSMQAITLSQPANRITALIPRPQPPQQNLAYYGLSAKEKEVQQFFVKYGQKLENENNVLSQRLQSYIDKERQKAEKILAERKKQERKDEEEAQREAEKKAAEQKRKDDEKKVRDENEAKIKAEQDAKDKAEADAVAQKKAEEEKKKREETSFIEKAQKYMRDLDKIRQYVEPYEKAKEVSKIRLGMKKIVNGRVNTLSEDVEKIRAVARDVNATIAGARQEDERNKSAAPELARAKAYFYDLLSSKVIVRVQAEGFNGQRGDGFPLAHMLAQVAKENKSLIPVLEGHIYKVCPTAIPSLPMPAEDATEDELMESLGMQKGKDGNYETFERFLNRTEVSFRLYEMIIANERFGTNFLFIQGIISIVADIISSEPADHLLFDGPAGGVKWLKRFLKQLPPAPHSPLPLLTAPVLDAFLTGAGHMLANCYEDDFKKILNYIEQKVMPRLDEGTIGAPSAIRLRKTTRDGFDGFKNNLPGRALKDLYHSSTQGGTTSTNSNHFGGGLSTSAPSSNPFGAAPAPSAQTPTPFGGSSVSDPFGSSTSAPTNVQSSFGQTQSGGSSTSMFGSNKPVSSSAAPSTGMNIAPSASPFGAIAPGPSPFSGTGNSSFGTSTAGTSTFGSPFGSNAQTPAPLGGATPASSPFGGATPASSSFGGTAAAPASFGGSAPVTAPFGGAAPGPSPFGGAAPAPTPFGGAAPSPSPFGGAAPAPTPFGGAAPSPSPFGGAAPSPSPFGGAAPSPSPFGGAAPAPTPFGGSAPGPSPFGGAAPAPTPFGGSATSFGGAAPIPTPFGSSAPSPSPFGGASPAPTPFGTAAPSPSPFGGASPAPTPFGGSATNPSPFGGTAPAPTPFGSAAAPSSFGAFAAAPPPTPFSGSNQQGGGFGASSGKQPCKFFARGQCKFGNNCRYSHDIQPQSTSFSSPFGGPRR